MTYNSDNKKQTRPVFPKRAVITGGMPYGNKELHFGHVGGVFVQADVFARFLRDRIGAENVIFVSGTDCYGATIEAGYEQAVAEGFQGDITDFVSRMHKLQKQTLDSYQISLNLYGASALGEAGEIHKDLSERIFLSLYDKGVLKSEETLQFYDREKDTFLNGRQVTGYCPIQGCRAETAYADECSLGHQYYPSELLFPVSTLSGETPILKPVKNWYFDLPGYIKSVEKSVETWDQDPARRNSLISVVSEFLRRPAVFINRDFMDKVKALKDLPKYMVADEPGKASVALEFDVLSDRESAVEILSNNQIKYRTGKTLVPFRLSGNVDWGIPVPGTEGIKDLTFWVWPESLWAPISFTKTYLGDGKEGKKWEDWWKSKDAKVYQFIGEDNIYFYAIAETGLFEALDEGFTLPLIVPNRHLLFGKTKASSSGKVKPPQASELLNYYTSDQLRFHFFNASLAERSVGFEPKAVMGGAEGEFDTVLYEGNLATNVFNRLVRSCFYTMQKHSPQGYPMGEISRDVIEDANKTILEYEKMMSELTFDKVFELLNVYLREANKQWAARSKSEDPKEINSLIRDTFHVIRVCTALFHPIVPEGCDMIRQYLGADERIWDWEYIFRPLEHFFGTEHSFKFLEPRVDFFVKHPSQLK